jgi:hypothetical protein
MLRHTFCSHLAMNGVPARSIQELARHQSMLTTERYMHLSPSAVGRGRFDCWNSDRPIPEETLGRRPPQTAKRTNFVREKVVSREGIEPSTRRLRVCCSAN